MATHPASSPRRGLNLASGLLLMAAGCATAQVPVATAPVPTGQARIWFYRPYEPSESWNFANIDVNGSYIGAVTNGGAFYRDVPPGHYHIAPVSYNRDFNQDKDVDLAPDQQLYVKVVSLQNWDGARRQCLRDTFYAWLIPPQAAQIEIARDHSGL